MKFLEFFQNAGENSSKRLAGLTTTGVFLIAAIVGIIKTLVDNNLKFYVEILDTLALFAGACLGLGVLDRFKQVTKDKKNVIK